MNLKFKLGENKPVDLTIKRNWFTGNFVYFEDGEKHQLKNPLDLTTHFSFKLRWDYKFEVGKIEKYKIVVKHTRSRLFAGFRPQTYEIYVNGKLLKTYTGY